MKKTEVKKNNEKCNNTLHKNSELLETTCVNELSVNSSKSVKNIKKLDTKSTSQLVNNIVNKNIEDIKNNSLKIIKNKEEVLTNLDEYLFKEGTHTSCYKFMGAHYVTENKVKGFRFTTWAPKASKITVVGDFSDWKEKEENEMFKIEDTGLWSVFIPHLKEGMKYKFAVTNEWKTWTVLRADPYAFKSELRPDTASILTKESKYRWGDKKWLNKREKTNYFEKPMNIYELHLGSWKRKDNEFLTYDELSEILPKYVKEMGYTHIEFMPVKDRKSVV